MRNVDLGWIRVFVAVVRSGSLSQAARSLNLTQPAVSYQIRRAEREFGTPLLNRLHRGVEPTEAGARLYDILSPSVARLDELAARLRQDGRKIVLRLFTDYAFSGLWLIPRIHGFRAAHPECDIQIIASQHSDPARLEDGDTAVVFGARADFGPDAVLLLPEIVEPVCAPGYACRDLARADLIHLDSPAPSRWFDWDGYLAAQGVDRSPAARHGDMRCNTYSLVIEAALAGQGIALGWRGLVDPLLRRGALSLCGAGVVSGCCGYFLLPGRGGAAGARLEGWLRGAAGAALADAGTGDAGMGVVPGRPGSG